MATNAVQNIILRCRKHTFWTSERKKPGKMIQVIKNLTIFATDLVCSFQKTP